MKRRAQLVLALAATSLAACDGKVSEAEAPVKAAVAAVAAAPAALPDGPIERAAMCQGAMTAKAIPVASDGATADEAELLMIMHPAYIVASESGTYEPSRLAAVSEKGPAYADRFRKSGGTEAIIAKCHDAFPAMTRQAALPADPRKSRRTCAALGSAVLESFQLTERVNSPNAPAYARMLGNLEEEVIRDFWKEGVDEAAMRRIVLETLAEAMTGSAPGALLQQCVEKYG